MRGPNCRRTVGCASGLALGSGGCWDRAQARPSSHDPARLASRESWDRQKGATDVRDPSFAPPESRVRRSAQPRPDCASPRPGRRTDPRRGTGCTNVGRSERLWLAGSDPSRSEHAGRAGHPDQSGPERCPLGAATRVCNQPQQQPSGLHSVRRRDCGQGLGRHQRLWRGGSNRAAAPRSRVARRERAGRVGFAAWSSRRIRQQPIASRAP